MAAESMRIAWAGLALAALGCGTRASDKVGRGTEGLALGLHGGR